MIQYYFEKVKGEQKKNGRMYSYRGGVEGGFNGCLERLNVHLEGENGYLERVIVSVPDHKKPDTLNRYLNGRIRRVGDEFCYEDDRANAPEF